jgi:hypothetical protein
MEEATMPVESKFIVLLSVVYIQVMQWRLCSGGGHSDQLLTRPSAFGIVLTW